MTRFYISKTYLYENKNTMKRNVIKLTESELRTIISESVKRIINEIGDTPAGQEAMGRLQARYKQRADNERQNYNMDGYHSNMDRYHEIGDKMDAERYRSVAKAPAYDRQQRETEMYRAGFRGYDKGMRNPKA
jgi:hypothetical protein